MSKLLIRILQTALIPAALMVVSKLIGLYLSIAIYGMDVKLSNEIKGLFSVQILIGDANHTLLANSISDITLLLTMALGSLYLITRYVLYKNTADNPRTIVKLSKLNLLKWVTDKDTVFVKVFVWVLFLLASSATIIANSLNGLTYSWIGVTAFIVSILFIWGLIHTFEIELEKLYPSNKENSLY